MARGIWISILALGCAYPTFEFATDGAPVEEAAVDDATGSDAATIDSEVASDGLIFPTEDTAVDTNKPDAPPVIVPCGNGKLDPGEACDDGNAADGDGCSSDCHIEGCAAARTGLADWKKFPHIAVCGALMSYANAVTRAPMECGKGFHICNAYTDVAKRFPASATTTESFRAWLRYDGAKCISHKWFRNGDCTGLHWVNAVMDGEGGCNNGTGCGEGYRPAINTEYYGHSLREGAIGDCIPHASYLCAYPGGDLPFTARIACCRD